MHRFDCIIYVCTPTSLNSTNGLISMQCLRPGAWVGRERGRGRKASGCCAIVHKLVRPRLAVQITVRWVANCSWERESPHDYRGKNAQTSHKPLAKAKWRTSQKNLAEPHLLQRWAQSFFLSRRDMPLFKIWRYSDTFDARVFSWWQKIFSVVLISLSLILSRSRDHFESSSEPLACYVQMAAEWHSNDGELNPPLHHLNSLRRPNGEHGKIRIIKTFDSQTHNSPAARYWRGWRPLCSTIYAFHIVIEIRMVPAKVLVAGKNYFR